MRVVLLIEDNGLVRRGIAAFLSRHRYLAVEARDAHEAAARIAEVVPDLILTDIGLPAVSGVQLLPLLRLWVPGAPVVALTGLPHMAEDAGFDAVLVKPLDPDKLLATLSRFIAAAQGGGDVGIH